MKSVRIRNYLGPHFPAFGLNTERYSVSLRIQSEYGKIRTIITPNTDTFNAMLVLASKSNWKWLKNCQNQVVLEKCIYSSEDFTWHEVTAWKMSVFGVFLVRIFPYLDWIQRDTPYPSLFGPNVGKYGPEKLRIRTLFTQCLSRTYIHLFKIFWSGYLVPYFSPTHCCGSNTNLLILKFFLADI